MDLDKLFEYIVKGGWIAFAAILLFIFFNYERVGIILSDFYELLAWTGKYFQKKYVAQEISSRIGLAIKKLNRETKDLMPFSLEIRWVDPAKLDRESFIKENKVVLRLDYYVNQGKNLANVVQEFVSTAHMREPKSYLSEPLRRSLDLRLAARYLKECGRRDALVYFVDSVLKPALQDRSLHEVYSKLETLDQFGYFTRVLLSEFLDLAARFYPQRVGLPEISDETTRFMDFLCTFPPRPPGGDIELDFKGKYIKARFVLVAKLPKFAAQGTEPYVNRIAEGLSTFADTAYVCAMDKLIGAASRVAKQAKDEYGLFVDAVHHYGAQHHGKLRSAVMIRLKAKRIR